MNRKLECCVSLPALLLMTSGAREATWADHEEHKKKSSTKKYSLGMMTMVLIVSTRKVILSLT